jgi:phospho-N-acetylmuramoyl-pentapeptide-transferase
MLAFSVFNSNPASIFMGDAGSMGLGSIIASFFIILKLELVLPFVGFVIFMEALSVIIQVIYFKKTGGGRIFKMSPLHHHYQLCGIKEQKIAEFAFLLTVVLSLIFISSFF